MLWIAIPLAVLCCLVWMILLPLEIRLKFHHVDGDDGGVLQIRYLFGLIRIERELTALRTKLSKEGPAVEAKGGQGEQGVDEGVVSTKDLKNILGRLSPIIKGFKDSKRVLVKLAPHLHVVHLRLNSSLGVADAPLTGMSVGIMHALSDTLLGWLSFHCTFRTRPQIQVVPVYQRVVFNIETDGIIQVRFGYAILAVVKLLIAWRRRS